MKGHNTVFFVPFRGETACGSDLQRGTLGPLYEFLYALRGSGSARFIAGGKDEKGTRKWGFRPVLGHFGLKLERGKVIVEKGCNQDCRGDE